MLEIDGYRYMPDANTDRISTSVSLPYRMENDIGLSIPRLNILRQLGGFNHLSIGSYSEEDIPTPPSGNQPTYHASLLPIFGVAEDTPKQAVWPKMIVNLDVTEIGSRIFASDGGILNSDSWAKEINKAITQGIREVGKHNLLSIRSDHDKVTLAGLRLINILMASHLKPRPNIDLIDFGGIALCSGVVVSVVNSCRYGIEGAGKGYRGSLLYGFEVERYLALQVASRTLKVAKALK